MLTTPVQHAIEATGIPSEIARCARIMQLGGKIVLLSYYDALETPFMDLFVKEATMLVSREWAFDDLLAARDMVASGAVEPRRARDARGSDRTLRGRVRYGFQRPVDPQGGTPMGVSKNLTVAIYGKGGAGKSFLTSMIAKELSTRKQTRAADGLRSQAR